VYNNYKKAIEMDERLLIEVAKNSILEEFQKKEIINKKELVKKYPFLSEKRAIFVTLKIDNQLRGCIGSILPRMTLIDGIIYNAKQAAFADPRFTPLTYEEFQKINIEISILTIPQILEYTNKNDLRNKITKKDGVIIILGDKQATFLPSVWEELPDFNLFFKYLCLKAGVNENCLDYHPTIYTYQAEIIEEDK
jgi:AmmeMemoRadiSam system protein A